MLVPSGVLNVALVLAIRCCLSVSPSSDSFSCGVNLFAFDSAVELEKIARSAPGAEVFCRILTSNEGAEWPLSRKFGCDTDMAGDLIVRAAELGLKPRGISFHVGSQQTDPTQWDDALFETRKLFDRVKAEAGIDLDLVNLGGGFPSRYDKEVPGCKVLFFQLRISTCHSPFPRTPHLTLASLDTLWHPLHPLAPLPVIFSPALPTTATPPPAHR